MRLHVDRAALRIRVGLGMFVFSWLPIAQFVIEANHLEGSQATTLRASIWGVQWVIGVVGLVIAGRTVAGIVKHSGWRRTPKLLWRMLRTGQAVVDPPAPAAPPSIS